MIKRWFSDHFLECLIAGGLALALFAVQIMKYFFISSFREAVTKVIAGL
jgi:hypothetical protein